MRGTADLVRPYLTMALLAVAAAEPLCGQTGGLARSDVLDTIAIAVEEGTALSVDLSRDGRMIAFDLLGQIWTLDAGGGEARAVTDAVGDEAEDLDPSLSPDRTRVLFAGERAGVRGLWLADLAGGPPRLLSRTVHPEGFDGQGAWSPDGRAVAFARVVTRVDGDEVVRLSEIALLDLESGEIRSLAIEGIPEPDVRDPAWSPDGTRIGFVASWVQDAGGGRIWSVSAAGGAATPLVDSNVHALAPAWSPRGDRLAFLAPDSAGRLQVWVQSLRGPAGGLPVASGVPRRLTDHEDVAPTRVRWTPDGRAVLYSADGGLWRVPADGGAPVGVPFVARLALSRPRIAPQPARFPAPGVPTPARGHMGLALSPSGTRVGVIALGRLWVVPITGEPPAFGEARAVADVPASAQGLAWSPDEAEIAFATGPLEFEDLVAVDLATGVTRTVTALEGGEREPMWSPDGAWIGFVHATSEGFRLRLARARGEVSDLGATRDLGEIAATWVGETADAPVWSPDSRALLVRLEPDATLGTQADLVSVTGERRRLERFPDAPIFLQWPAQERIIYARHDQLWAAGFDTLRGTGDPVPLSDAPALYPSTARDGSILFLSEGGWRLRRPSGGEHVLGWPLRYTPPVPPPLLVRNARLVDGTGAALSAPRDVLVRAGRIERIAPAGDIPDPGDTRILDAGGRIMIPGLVDLHMHGYDVAGLPGRLYYGVTTIRDQGSRIATLVGAAESIAAGVIPGPRVSYGGFQFFTDWPFDGEEWRGIEPEADPGHVERAVALAAALGAHHVKTRTFRRWDINARIIEAARRRGLRVTGHCAHPLPLVAAGIEAQEHVGYCNARGGVFVYDDILQLYRAAGISVIPTVVYGSLAIQVSRDRGIAPDEGLDPWQPIVGLDWMLAIGEAGRARFAAVVESTRRTIVRLRDAGVRMGAGTDVWQVPWGVHLELEELVRSGLTPLEAIHAATGAAAEILGAGDELGTIEPGKAADLLILDGDPLADIRATRRIQMVVKGGEIVDRERIRTLSLPDTASRAR